MEKSSDQIPKNSTYANIIFHVFFEFFSITQYIHIPNDVLFMYTLLEVPVSSVE
jgi:hypothetical protein